MITFNLEYYDEKEKTWKKLPTAVFPLKIANLLDEQLDEASVTVKQITKEYFLPLTLFRINVENTPDGVFSQTTYQNLLSQPKMNGVSLSYSNGKITESYSVNMLLANDKSIETPSGSGKYNHDLYLIELTKILEGYIGDTLRFTNPLGNNYTS